MKRRWIFGTILLLASCRGDSVKEPYRSIPRSIQGWAAQEADEIYNRETLYNYIDGGAELYLTYSFQEAFVRTFVKEDHSGMEIALDVYDMGSSADAFGIFSCEREDEEIGIGQDSEYGGGLLRFWKDRYFVSITALGEESVAKPAMLEMARGVEAAIRSEGDRPTLLSRLPGEGVKKDEIRFFHTMQCLNNHYFVASENILNLDRETRCLFAPYTREQETGYLLIVEYGNDTQADSAYRSFLDTYLPEARETGVGQTENQRWTLARLNGRFLVVVFDAPSGDWASSLLSGVTL